MKQLDFLEAQRRLLARQEARPTLARLDATADGNASKHATVQRSAVAVIATSKASAWWSIIKSRTGTSPSSRSGQFDAELLDETLLHMLCGRVSDGLKYFNPHLKDDWSSEIQLVLRVALFKVSMWNHNSSYGAALQGLRYSDARCSDILPAPPTKLQKLAYAVFYIGGTYGWEKWENWLSVRDQSASSNPSMLAKVSDTVHNTYRTLSLVNFLIFLLNGKYRTLLDLILRMRLAPNSNASGRDLSFEYLNRQLVWHAYTEFLLFLLPLIGVNRWRLFLSRTWTSIKHKLHSARGLGSQADHQPAGHGELWSLPEHICAICFKAQTVAAIPSTEMLITSGSGVGGGTQSYITNPYTTNTCKCIYCFVCIATNIEVTSGLGWPCLRCKKLATGYSPWRGDVYHDDAQQMGQLGKNFFTLKNSERKPDRIKV